jgi:hypothetical protein
MQANESDARDLEVEEHMKPAQEIYAKIPSLPPYGTPFTHIPGVYCQECGNVFALYSTSVSLGEIDENGKPYYKTCCRCNPGFTDLMKLFSSKLLAFGPSGPSNINNQSSACGVLSQEKEKTADRPESD